MSYTQQYEDDLAMGCVCDFDVACPSHPHTEESICEYAGHVEGWAGLDICITCGLETYSFPGVADDNDPRYDEPDSYRTLMNSWDTTAIDEQYFGKWLS